MIGKAITIENETRKTTLAREAIIADNAWTRLRGLLGRPQLRDGQAMVIRPSTGIHTFFMGYPIDVIYLDATNHVVRSLEHLRPFRFGPIDLRTKQVIELPAGTIARSRTQEGDRIALS
ncbi:MAG: DUF192 domain-containing protein [Anaerolineae bacterium]